ncbi:hypothetical protein BC829DRAFT_488683 [Chytridium lagenaria]|nr:hypothetical protein BC829DRAFT_488683 [Chytridium lagenaria]
MSSFMSSSSSLSLASLRKHISRLNTSTKVAASLTFLIALGRLDSLIPADLRARSRFLFFLSSLSRISRHPFKLLATLLKSIVTYLETKTTLGGPLHALSTLLTDNRLESFLLAYIPTSHVGKRFHTGVYAVDMFVTSTLATLAVSSITMSLDASKHIIESLTSPFSTTDSVQIRIEHLRRGKWWSCINEHYEALAVDDNDEESNTNITDFHILPSNATTSLTFTHESHEFIVTFDFDDIDSEEKSKSDYNPREPAMIIQRKHGPTSTIWMKEWIARVTNEFVRFQKSNKVRGRYEYEVEEGTWGFVHQLNSSKGVEAVALDQRQEELLIKDLEAFMGDKDFYKRMGLPYRRGFLFSGPPGTGKTSLINAISAQYNRDISTLRTTKQLQNAFSRVPKNSLIVFEDVDAQSRCVWDRERRRAIEVTEFSLSVSADDDDNASESSSSTAIIPTAPPVLSYGGGPTPPPAKDKAPTLATLLNCLDGHSLNENIMIVMTSNHPEVLDPALIRPGRVDLHLRLAYITRYQINRMFANVCEDPTATVFYRDGEERDGRIAWDSVEDGVLAPCDVMRIMMLLRKERERIPEAIRERFEEVKMGRPGIASGGSA